MLARGTVVRRLSNAAIVLSATAFLVALIPFLQETDRSGGAFPPAQAVTAPTNRQPVVFSETASGWVQTTCVATTRQGQRMSGYGVVVGISGDTVQVAPRAFATGVEYGDGERILLVDQGTTRITLGDGSTWPGSPSSLKAGDAIFYTGHYAGATVDACAGPVPLRTLQIIQTTRSLPTPVISQPGAPGVPRNR